MGTLVQNRQILSGLSPSNKLNPWRRRSILDDDDDPANRLAPCRTAETSTSDPSNLRPTLDHQIWSNLQPELVARVLSHLPLTALVHTTLVCRKWDREVFAGRILGHDTVASCSKGRALAAAATAASSSSASWLFLFENGGPGNAHRLHAYDPARDDWHTSATIPHFATVQKIGGLALCGAASGLMLYKISALKSHFSRFGVFNPITRSWKKLPPLIRRRQRPVVTMFVLQDPTNLPSSGGGHYKVVVAGGLEYEQQVHSTEVYDSRSECWRLSCETAGTPPAAHVCDDVRTTTAFCDGVVYHMRFNQVLAFDPNRENHTFMAYDTKRARWRALRAALPPGLVFTEYPSLKRMWQGRAYITDVLPPFLVESRGRLLLVGFLAADLAAAPVSGIAIWELHAGKRAWHPVDAMPDTLFGRIRPKVCASAYVDPPSYLRFEIRGAGRGNSVYIFQADEGGGGVVVLCDLSHSPPLWRCVHEGVVQYADHAQDLQACVIDLRLDTLI